MKKRKILIPALAVLAFSTVASVTGTVAWFTSTSAVTVSTTSFQVTGLDGSLRVELGAGIGTKKSSDGKKIEAGNNGKTGDALITNSLTHGSFDHATKTVYSMNQQAAGFISRGNPTAQGAADTSFQEDKTALKYNCFTWTLTFKYTNEDSAGPSEAKNFYFDVGTLSAVTLDKDHALVDNTANAGRAFRLAFLSDDSSAKPIIWSPLTGTKYSVNSSGSEGSASSYVSGTASTNVTAYPTTYASGNSGNLIYKGDGEAIPANTAGETGRKDYLGKFNSSNGWIVVTCVAWFEGCDSLNVHNEAAKPSVSVDMSFYLRNAK